VRDSFGYGGTKNVGGPDSKDEREADSGNEGCVELKTQSCWLSALRRENRVEKCLVSP
jgi:hypothetical protein